MLAYPQSVSSKWVWLCHFQVSLFHTTHSAADELLFCDPLSRHYSEVACNYDHVCVCVGYVFWLCFGVFYRQKLKTSLFLSLIICLHWIKRHHILKIYFVLCYHFCHFEILINNFFEFKIIFVSFVSYLCLKSQSFTSKRIISSTDTVVPNKVIKILRVIPPPGPDKSPHASEKFNV